MSRKLVSVLTISIVLSLCLVSISLKLGTADIADWVSLNISGTMANNSSISMPNADARIRMEDTPDGTTVRVSGLFEVISSTTTNSSLAFVYPNYWRGYGGSEANINFTIQVNNTQINHTVISWEDLISQGFITDPEKYGGTWIESADFVLFTFEMQADLTYTIRVMTRVYPLETVHYGSFSYIIGSATTFSGETHQTVEILVEDEVEFQEFSFTPEEYLTVYTNESGTIGNWDFTVNSETNFSSVGVSFTVHEYHPLPPIPIPAEITVLTVGVIVVIVLSFAVVHKGVVRS